MMRLTNYVKELLFRKIDIMDVKNLHKAIAKLRKIHIVVPVEPQVTRIRLTMLTSVFTTRTEDRKISCRACFFHRIWQRKCFSSISCTCETGSENNKIMNGDQPSEMGMKKENIKEVTNQIVTFQS